MRGAHPFPSTRWSRILAGPPGAPGEAARDAGARAAFEELAARYWSPVAAYARSLGAGGRGGATTDEEAREVAQEFFLWMLEVDFPGKADPARGSFRGFIKRSLVNFLHDRERKRRTAKRGGDRAFRSLADERGEAGAAAGPMQLPDPEGRAPDAVLDDLWRRELLAQAADRLEEELARQGKAQVFAVFRDYYLGDEELDYAAVAARHGITKVDVSNRLMLAKRRYRALLKLAVQDTVRSEEELREELDWLFSGDVP